MSIMQRLFSPRTLAPQRRRRTNCPEAAEVEILEERALMAADMDRIENTHKHPWRMVVDMDRRISSTSVGNCTGAMVGQYHVLTAAHCVYDKDDGGWHDRSTFRLRPGRDNDFTPFGTARVTKMRSWKAYTQDGSSNYDMALLTLDRSIGKYTGYFTMKAYSSASLNNAKLNLAGYPSELSHENGRELWHSFGPVDHVTDNRIYYDRDEGLEGHGGHSGAPLWRTRQSKRYIVGVHAGGKPPGLERGTRLTVGKLNQIKEWKAADPTPNNKPALADYDQWYSRDTSYTTDYEVGRDESFTAGARIVNGGTARARNVKIKFYLSSNKNITASDYYLGSKTISVSAFRYATANWTGTLPSSIPAGNYYLGWTIDADNTVSEFSDGENEGYHNTRIKVIAQDSLESNGSFSQATNLGIRSSYSNNSLTIHSESDQDYFRFVAAKSGQLRLRITFDDKDGDIDVRFYSSSKKRLVSSTSNTDNELITHDVQAGLTYYFKVFGYKDDANNYFADLSIL